MHRYVQRRAKLHNMQLVWSVPHARLDAAHHAKVVVYQPPAANCINRNISRVRVCVEQAVPQQLLQVALDREARQARAVEAHLIDGAPVVDLDAGHVLHDNDFLTQQVGVDVGHLDPGRALKVLCKVLGVRGLQVRGG